MSQTRDADALSSSVLIPSGSQCAPRYATYASATTRVIQSPRRDFILICPRPFPEILANDAPFLSMKIAWPSSGQPHPCSREMLYPPASATSSSPEPLHHREARGFPSHRRGLTH